MDQCQKDKNWFAQCLSNKDLVKQLKNIKLVLTDIDGCLTNASIAIAEEIDANGNNSTDNIGKSFSSQDGFITSKITKNNLLSIAFLTGRVDKATQLRAKMVSIPDDMCYIGICNGKKDAVLDVLKKTNINKEEALFFGDDFLDFEIKSYVGFFACPQNTPFYFQECADLIMPKEGGNHAFRLLLDLILYIQGKHFAQDFIKQSLQ